jgi:3-oxoacyl-[acyl-carrier protein] reductase
MDLHIKDHFFIVGGASSGLGKAVAIRLLQEGAQVLGIARSTDALLAMELLFPERFSFIATDITWLEGLQEITNRVGDRQVHGVLVNAGGPPAKMIMETTPEDWDDAYNKLLRWKVPFVKALIPAMKSAAYGRMLFLESQSVKQPIENLVLSNSLRMAVVGFAKTLSREIAGTGITVNVIGPGSHDTAAIERLYKKKSEQTGLAETEVRQAAIRNIPAGALGQADDFAQLAAWLLSPASRYVTGQVYLVDGGSTEGV